MARTGPTVSILCAFLIYATTCFADVPVNVLTHHNGNDRTGRNLQEALLNTSNVNMNGGQWPGTFRPILVHVFWHGEKLTASGREGESIAIPVPASGSTPRDSTEPAL